jgi:hypothetical protein
LANGSVQLSNRVLRVGVVSSGALRAGVRQPKAPSCAPTMMRCCEVGQGKWWQLWWLLLLNHSQLWAPVCVCVYTQSSTVEIWIRCLLCLRLKLLLSETRITDSTTIKLSIHAWRLVEMVWMNSTLTLVHNSLRNSPTNP